MNHELLKTLIYDQHQIIRDAVIVPRQYKLEPNGNYVLVGLRRAGKSTMLYQKVRELIASGVAWEQIIYINFEDERLSEFKVADFNDIISVQAEMSNQKGYFFLDEIQNIEGWEKFARRLADSKERVYITGSNAKMLSKDIETTLGARYLTLYVSPYSFTEYLSAHKKKYGDAELAATKTAGEICGYSKTYMHDGGFPESLLYTSKREYLNSLYRKILLGDIITRNGIRNDFAIRILMKKIAESVRSEVSFSKLHGILKAIGLSVGKDTIIDYISYAEDAYLLFHIQNLYAKFAEKEGNPKYYFNDNGLLNLFLTDKDSALLENIVAIQLCRMYPENVYYLKSAKTGIDIDFYMPEEKLAVQAAFSLNEDSFEREVESLVKLSSGASEELRCVIVTYDEKKELEYKGTHIKVIPLYLFLLGKYD